MLHVMRHEMNNSFTFLISSIEISVPFLFLQVRAATEMSCMAYLEIQSSALLSTFSSSLHLRLVSLAILVRTVTPSSDISVSSSSDLILRICLSSFSSY